MFLLKKSGCFLVSAYLDFAGHTLVVSLTMSLRFLPPYTLALRPRLEQVQVQLLFFGRNTLEVVLVFPAGSWLPLLL